ncbi:MAG TPA: CDP-alcohol phosphatidyltransferase family protein [Candidatus Saccharimonadales bacterium]|jgi:cardiolipin synthase|nr:CDP-alcohol phosphatidyltransferase family protein [Candidatus Saccharimonadales bacterium]
MLSQLRATPNLLTLLRLIFVPFAVIAVLGNHYAWALGIFIVAGITDGLDGLLARVLEQQTLLGQYLDPVADKLLLSTMFLTLSFVHSNPVPIPWPVTVLVFFRDIVILVVCTLLYATGTLRTFRPSWMGKANTLAQIVTVPLVMLHQILPGSIWFKYGRRAAINATVALTIISGVHYVIRLAIDLRKAGEKNSAAGVE